MRKIFLLGLFSCLTLLAHAGSVEVIEARGWMESAYVKFMLVDGAKNYNVYVKGGQYADYTKIDAQLVRNYGTYGRADAVGLQAGTYAMKIVPVSAEGTEMTAQENTVSDLEVRNYPREGFAFINGCPAPGAYNSDGTLKAGAKVELPDYDGDTALIIACQNGSNEDVINLLLDYAKDVNVANRSGMTALHYAVQNNKYSKACIEHFLKAGADILAGDRSGKTAYDYAKGAGRSDLEKLLQPPKGAEPKPPKIQGIPDRPVKAPQRVTKADKKWLLLLCDTKVVLLGIVVLVVLVGGGFALLRKRKKG